MAYNPRLARQARKARGSGDVKLNITSMMDMFTIILVFLLKSFSTEGQLVTPATGLLLPTSSVERTAKEALCDQKDFMIPRLYDVLSKYAKEARKSSEMFGKDFSGEITIQGDVSIPYKLLTRIMYTCGQSGYPVMNLIVYRKE